MRILSSVLLCGLVVVGCDCDDETDVPTDTPTDVMDVSPNDMAVDGVLPPGDMTAAQDGGDDSDGDTPPPSDMMMTTTDMLPDGAVVLDGGSVCVPATCQGVINKCGNCLDDDGDGFVDADDPDCLGACDNNESGLYHEIAGGDTPNCKLDCYYDKDQGSGNDGCSFDARCDMESPDNLCPYVSPPPRPARCDESQSDACLDFCQPLTPNGCDCFGCCLIGGNTVFVGTLDNVTGTHTCTLERALDGDLEACHLCTQQTDCFNSCERCEVCLGKTVNDLPADCFPPPPVDMGTPPDAGSSDGGPRDAGTPVDMNTPDPRCPDGRQPCGAPGDSACEGGYYCLTGCCTYFG